MSNTETEVVIIGAGPAGTTASIFLAREGIKHIIMDKATFPRDKICGDALSGKTKSILKMIDPKLAQQITDDDNFLESWGIRFVSPDSQMLDVPFRMDLSKEEEPPGFTSKRVDFDNFMYNLIDDNYAKKMLNCKVIDVASKDESITITYSNEGKEKSISAKMVIGAGGDACLVTKKLAELKKDTKHYAHGLRTYYKNVTGFHSKNFIELHFIKEALPGYLWIFPLPNNQANVGIGLPYQNKKQKDIPLKDMMLNAINNNPALKERFKNAELVDPIKRWGLPLGSIKRKISGERFLLTGDAASLIDPFTGEGIGNAMISGRMAALMSAKAIKENNFSALFLSEYDKNVYDKLWDELKLSRTIQKLLNYDWLFNFVVNRALKNPTIRETLTCMFADLDMRAKLKSPSFYFKLLFDR